MLFVARVLSSWPVRGALALLSVSACDFEATPTVDGVIVRSETVDITKGYLFVKAVPDHPDGLAITRPYTGIRVFEDSCPVEHLEFPLPFMLLGEQEDIDRTRDPRWRLVVWESDDPYSVWPEAGGVYGTTTFEFEEHQGSWASDIPVVIDQSAR